MAHEQYRFYSIYALHVCALTLLTGRQEGHPTCKKLGVRLLVMTVWLELPGRERSLTISSGVWIQCTSMTDRGNNS